MGVIKTVTVEYGRTFNIGNYESIRLGLQVTKDILEGENISEEVQKSMKGMQSLVQKEAGRIIAERKNEKT